MIVRIQVDRDVALAVPPAVRRRLAQVATRAGRRVGLDSGAIHTLGLRIVGDAAMIELHRAYLGEAHATDVLSFPADPEDGFGVGDIAIDWDQVRRQAAVPGVWGWCDEAVQLVVHGLAHLVGHDHGRRPDARRMLRAERRAARSAAIAPPTRPYAPERSAR